MGLIGPERTTVEVCPTCRRDVRDGRHATSSHQNDEPVEVEYVRADLHRRAVEAASLLAMALRRPEDREARREALTRWDVWLANHAGGQ